MNDEYGDPETDVDAAILDDTLRELLNDISPAGPLPDADAIAQIREAIDVGWPGGSPPAAEELITDHTDDAFEPFDHSDDWSDNPVEDSHFDTAPDDDAG